MEKKTRRFGGKQLLVLIAALALVGLLVFAVVSWSNQNEKTARAQADSAEDLPVTDTLSDTLEGL